jgi:aryl-alcohol dehydrogenase-like predicted oxidoreductase
MAHEMKGVSDTPAWVVSRANQYARDHALTPFVIYQGAWNVLERSFERDIIPMARAEGSFQIKEGDQLADHKPVGMALAPWNVLAAGKIRSDAEEERRRQTGENGRTLSNPNWERNEKEKAVCDALEKVAQEIGARSITAGLFRHLLNQLAQLTPSL